MGLALIDYRWGMPQCFCTNRRILASRILWLICAKDQQVVRFVIFDEVLESTSCFVVNGDNRFDSDPRLQIPQGHSQETKTFARCSVGTLFLGRHNSTF